MQQLNPLGSGGMWHVAVLISLSVWSFVIITSISQWTEATYPELLIGCITFFSAAITVHLWAAAPPHAPYRSTPYRLVAALSTLGAVSQVFAMHTNDPRMAVVWGPIATAFLMASASVFRPALDQFLTGFAVVTVMASAVIIDGQAHDHVFGMTYVALAVVGIVIIIMAGQASYTLVATQSLDAWNRSTRGAQLEQLQNTREKVSADVMAQLSREFQAEAEPLLISVVQAGRISPTEVENSRTLAERVRSRLLEINEQNWLQAAGSDVVDEHHLVDTIDDSVRSALIALCVGIELSGLGRPRFELTQGSRPGAVEIRMHATVGENLARARIDLAPYIRVVYVVFDDVRVSFRDDKVSLQFKYGER